MFCIFYSKFGDTSLNGSWIIAWISSWLTDTDTHAGKDNTRRPKLASGKNECLPKHHWPIYIVPRCLGSLSTLDIASLRSIVRNWKCGSQQFLRTQTLVRTVLVEYKKAVKLYQQSQVHHVERRQTLGHPRSINPNMINHVPQQSPLIF